MSKAQREWALALATAHPAPPEADVLAFVRSVLGSSSGGSGDASAAAGSLAGVVPLALLLSRSQGQRGPEAVAPAIADLLQRATSCVHEAAAAAAPGSAAASAGLANGAASPGSGGGTAGAASLSPAQWSSLLAQAMLPLWAVLAAPLLGAQHKATVSAGFAALLNALLAAPQPRRERHPMLAGFDQLLVSDREALPLTNEDAAQV